MIQGFSKSVRLGFKAVECDVRLSKDKVPVVIHDKTIQRTTGDKGIVSRMTSEALQKYDIPTLDDVLEFMKPHPNITLFLEIKDEGYLKNNILVDKVVDVLILRDMTNRCAIISFKEQIIKRARARFSNINTGYLYGPMMFRDPIKRKSVCNANMLWLHYKLITPALIKKCAHNDIPIFAWTVNDKQAIDVLLEQGVTNIVTDLPDIILHH